MRTAVPARFPTKHVEPGQNKAARGSLDRFSGGLRPAGGTQTLAPGILVADDEPAVCCLLQMVLRQQGFVVWIAADGHEAVRLYQRHRAKIALVLLDVRMPGLDGFQALAALRQLNQAVVCCFMTGDAGNRSESELMRQGALRVFAKPFALAGR